MMIFKWIRYYIVKFILIFYCPVQDKFGLGARYKRIYWWKDRPTLYYNFNFERGQIIKLVDNCPVWLVEKGFGIRFLDSPIYMKVDHWSYETLEVFGHKIDKNLYGPIEFKNHMLKVKFYDLDFPIIPMKEENFHDEIFWIDYVYNPKESELQRPAR